MRKTQSLSRFTALICSLSRGFILVYKEEGVLKEFKEKLSGMEKTCIRGAKNFFN